MAQYEILRDAVAEAVEGSARSGWDFAIVGNVRGLMSVVMAQNSRIDGEIGRSKGWTEPIGGEDISDEDRWHIDNQIDDIVDRIESGN